MAGGANIAFSDTYAWVLAKKGQLSDAGRVFHDILGQIDLPGDAQIVAPRQPEIHPVIWDHAGDTMYRLGWTDAAVEYWTQAMDLAGSDEYDPPDRETRQILQQTPQKLQAIRSGQTPAVSPLGVGISPPDFSDLPETPTP
jgi:hypothetical protein